MLFTELPLRGSFAIDLQKIEDERGFFARAYCFRELEHHGLNPRLVQCNLSFNAAKHTLRGMHFQLPPHEEAKLVRCTRGAIYDVIIDLRRDSPSYCKWLGVELTAENRRMLYVPEGVAHGYLTLTEGAEVFYQVSEFYDAEVERGVRWNDPAFGIVWPENPRVISTRDSSHPNFVP